jgi:hypothetical protein
MRSKRASGLAFAAGWSLIVFAMLAGLSLWSLGLATSLGTPTHAAAAPSVPPGHAAPSLTTLSPDSVFAAQSDACAQGALVFNGIVSGTPTGMLMSDIHC